ncbi:MAG: aromatic ring-hydroxylating dioxygenase subunit alpha [Betaproteobacteria bacterium]|nr:aromatic ring-hydroxylating dioxygenase subunit alpha [Betaproteobacteria bacterium]
MMLRNFWYVAAATREVNRSPLARTICETPIVMYRTGSGDPVALRDLCSHRRAPLSKGRVVGDIIECPYHGLQFDRSGACVHIPSQDRIPAKAHISAFPVVERWGVVWIWMGRAELADAAAIPHKPWRADPAWNSENVHYFHVKANHLLMTDNLLDLLHVSFIHLNTIGFDAGAVKQDPLVTETSETVVRNTRVVKDIDPAPALRSWGDFSGKVDRISISDWTPPCYTAIQFINRNATSAIEFRLDHLITPETARSHHYWLLVSRNFRIDDAELTRRIFADNNRVAAEDMDIVEAQQRMIDLSPGHGDMPLRQDRGVVAAHRILKRLARVEKGATGKTAKTEIIGSYREPA